MCYIRKRYCYYIHVHTHAHIHTYTYTRMSLFSNQSRFTRTSLRLLLNVIEMLTIFQSTTMFTNVLLCLRMYFCNSILLRIRLYIYMHIYIHYIQVRSTIHFVTFSICSAYFCRETYMLLFSILSPMFFLYTLNHSLFLSFSFYSEDCVAF